MPAKRCIETKNMCLLFVDYCTERKINPPYPKNYKKMGTERKNNPPYPNTSKQMGIARENEVVI